MQWQSFVLGGLLCVLYGVGIAGVVYRVIARDRPGRALDAWCLGAAAAPLVLGLATIAMLAVLGDRPDHQYVLAIAIIGLAIIVTTRRAIHAMGRDARAAIGAAIAGVDTRRLLGLESVLLILLVLVGGSVAARVLSRPLFDNDPMEYALVGRALYEQRTLAAYPLVDADPRSGMYSPTTHPPLYVALIFLGNVIQGGADSPGPMRWIAPLCLALAALVLLRLGRTVSGWAAGLFTGLLLVSTPLLQLQASAGAIDLLPVLGLSLALAAAGLMAPHALASRVTITGVALGLALWTHSVAILFPLLIGAALIGMRRAQRRPWLAETAGVMVVAAAVAIAPYVRNVRIFGAMVSDTPPVVLVPQLDWTAYFTHARGLSTVYEQVVLGVFRGWTDQLFGATFWVMTAIAAAIVIRRRWRGLGLSWLVGGSLAMIVTYELLMMASVAAGSYEMIKNPRYTLPMIPAVVLVGGYGLARLARVRIRFVPIGPVLALAIVAVSCAPVLAQLRVQIPAAVAQVSAPAAADDPRLMGYAPFRLQRYMRDALPDDAVVLAFQPATMYYARHRMMSFLDPRLIPAYVERDPAAAAARLKDLGVTHLVRPPYALPAITDSAMAQLMADPRLARVVRSDEHYTLFELAGAAATAAEPGHTWDVSPARHAWTGAAEARWPVLGPVCQSGVTVSSDALQPTIRGCALVPRHRALYMAGNADDKAGTPATIATTPGHLYRYTARLSGRGFATILVEERHAGRTATHVIDGAVISDHERALTRSLKFDDGVTAVRFGVMMEGASSVAINGFTVEEIPQ